MTKKDMLRASLLIILYSVIAVLSFFKAEDIGHGALFQILHIVLIAIPALLFIYGLALFLMNAGTIGNRGFAQVTAIILLALAMLTLTNFLDSHIYFESFEPTGLDPSLERQLEQEDAF